MNVALYIARRYLFAKKSHNVINVISAISAIGLAVGTAALILILSVYNGFDKIISDNLSDLDPDILITAAEGKYFVPEGTAFDTLLGDKRIVSISSVLEDNVFVGYDDHQEIARAKGVDFVFEAESPVRDHVVEGTFNLHDGGVQHAAVGASLAHSMGIHPRFLSAIKLYYPERGKKINLLNPESSLGSVKVWPCCLFSISTDVDAQMMIIPIETMRELLGLEKEVSGLELRLAAGESSSKVKESVQELLGPGFKVLDRYRQHPSLYRMMRYEKLAIFLILIFVVIIVAFNIFGSLSMLIIEKEDDAQTLRAMGAKDSTIKRVFVFEGWLISLMGLAVGLVAGVGLALLQQATGLVKMPGNFLVSAYPVVLEWGDIVATFAGVAAIGLVISLLAYPSSRRADGGLS